MGRLPWFKFYSADFLVDPDVDMLPLEAQGLLVRMWCICHLEGSCPDDPAELARKTRISLQSILLSKPLCRPFFKLLNGRLHSYRMDEEKVKSDRARTNALSKGKDKTYANGSADGLASGSANGSGKTPAQSQSQIQKEDQKRGKKAPPSGYTQDDFDARDRRLLAEGFKEVEVKMKRRIGSDEPYTEEQAFQDACDIAGLSYKRGLEVWERGRKWPEGVAI